MGDDHDFGVSAEHRALFGGQSDAHALMESGNDLILQATRDTIEMEDVAARVMEDLVVQRSVMERFKDRLADINEGLDKAGKLMQEMMKRICGNKVMMSLVVLILIGGIAAIIWLRFFPPFSSHNGGIDYNSTISSVVTTTSKAATRSPAWRFVIKR
jgi:hypothetical protein